MPTKRARAKATDDDQEEEGEQGAWVLASWHCYWSVSLNFIASVDGRPKHDWHCTSERRSAYRWNSYQAAAKFQRTHKRLRSFIILNLTKVERQAEEQRQDYEEWIHRDREAEKPARVAGAK